MVEGYREYGEGQQTYQVYKYEWIGGMVNAPEPNEMCFGSKNANSKEKTDSKSGALIGFLVRVQDPSPGAKESRLAPVKTTSASYFFSLHQLNKTKAKVLA